MRGMTIAVQRKSQDLQRKRDKSSNFQVPRGRGGRKEAMAKNEDRRPLRRVAGPRVFPRVVRYFFITKAFPRIGLLSVQQSNSPLIPPMMLGQGMVSKISPLNSASARADFSTVIVSPF